MSFGTNQDDSLSGSGALFGLGGNDTLTSVSSAGDLYGGTGNDQLNVNFTSSTLPFFAPRSYVMDGGQGDDTLNMFIDIYDDTTARDYAPTTLAVGGAGQDVITIEQRVDMGWYNHPTAFTGGVAIPSTTVVDTVGDALISLGLFYYSDDGEVFGGTNVITGNGRDRVAIEAVAYANNNATTMDNVVSLGGGDDTLLIDQRSGYGDFVIDAGGGSDLIDLILLGEDGNDGGVAFDFAVDGGLGNDTVNVSVFEDLGGGGVSSQGSFDLGSGDDVFTLNGELTNSYSVDLGGGRDVARVVFNDGNMSLFGPDEIFSVVATGATNDIDIQLLWPDEEGFTTNVKTDFGVDTIRLVGAQNNTVDSGSNADVIFVESYGESYNIVDAGAGDDLVTVTFDTNSSYGSLMETTVSGGTGNDTINSTVDALGGTHMIDGGGGHDLIAMVGGTGAATGGLGADTITGTDGADTLEGGKGADVLAGGLGADEFVYDVAVNEGADTITDWDASEDILRLNGLVDSGAAGLADDIDAIASFSSDGTDVTMTLTSGSSITFAGVGTGAVSSITDLVDDPLSQLL